ncbi:hypothetical protein BDV29DRAFT_179284 [Aspergillus leporis]|uniref:Uncharacterized protein n=1 Tax=Aspergillus leporis TaxID=41062 RepID=A0A5N5WSR7_9EURO|nr:hypothetical protein BDV29DRAFT_179284 [Aspergillus leporis]
MPGLYGPNSSIAALIVPIFTELWCTGGLKTTGCLESRCTNRFQKIFSLFDNPINLKPVWSTEHYNVLLSKKIPRSLAKGN